MKHFRNILVSVFAVFISLVVFNINIPAAETEANLFNNPKKQDIAVSIEYEKDDITFKLISPSGNEITADTDTDTVTVFKGAKTTIIFLGDAESGQWKIKYDKGSNEKITINASIQDSSFWIDSFVTGPITDTTLPVTFKVTDNSPVNYEYSLILTTSKNSTAGKNLAAGSSTSGNEVHLDLSLTDVSSYDSYYLMLYVKTTGNTEYIDFSYSDAIKYTNPQAVDEISGLDITINHESMSVTADWANYSYYGLYSTFIEYYINDTLTDSSEYLNSDGTYAMFTYDENATKLTIKISVKNNNGLSSSLKTFDIDLNSSDNLKLTLPESGIVGSDIWSFDYENGNNTTVKFIVNGNSTDYILDGKGSKYITLPEERNTISINYTDSEGYRHVYNKVANVENTAPTLILSHNIDGVKTKNNSIIISGTTTGEKLVIGDKDISLNNGLFAYEYKLDNGENIINIIATTGANSISLTAVVTRESKGLLSGNGFLSSPIFPAVMGLLISALGIIITLLLTRKKKEKLPKKAVTEKQVVKPTKPKRKFPFLLVSDILLWIASIVLWIIFIVRKVFEGGSGYIALAYESLKKANAYLTLTTVFLILAIIITSLAFVLTILIIILKIVKHSKNRTINNIPQ